MDDEQLKFLKKAGQIGATALNHGAKMIRSGASVVQILNDVERFILDNGAQIAFPAQISINNVAAHFCPTDNDEVEIKDDDVVKLDCGASVNGYIADNAKTVNPSGEYNELVKASRNALNSALKIVAPDVELRMIGKEIQETISSYGFSPIKNLSGHGLGQYEIHTSPTIPNFDTGDTLKLKENDTIAIEPFASTGAGVVYESSNNPTIFSLINEKPVRSPLTRDVLKEIKKYDGLPFTTRWLTRKLGEGKVSFALRELNSKGMIHAHPPLLDKNKGLVSQAEHSVIVKDKPIIYTKLDDD